MWARQHLTSASNVEVASNNVRPTIERAGIKRREAGDEISKRAGSSKDDPPGLQVTERQAAQISPGSCIDSGEAELRGAGVHQEMQESRGAVPGEENTVTLKQRWSREAYNAYMREYMKRRRG